MDFINDKPGNYRWIIGALLFFATTINYLDRQLIGLLKPVLELEFSWTETDFAHIVMSFTAAYAVGLLFYSRVIDKIGTRLGYSIAIVIWSLAGMLHAAARSAFSFGLVRIVLGLGESGNFPAAMKAVAEWFPQKERALATGILNAGTSIGVILALILAPLILNYYGWQAVFIITGALGFIWLIPFLVYYRLPSKQKRLSKQELEFINSDHETSGEDSAVSIKWYKLFTVPETWAIVFGKFLIDPIYWFFLFWLPSYFSSAFHIDMTKPNIHLMIIYSATTLGCIGGGYFSSRLIKKGWPALKARKTVLLIFAILEIPVILIQFATNIWVVVGLISIAAAVHQAWATNIFTTATDLFPKQVVSSVVGLAGMTGAVGGILFPILVGYLLDTYKMNGNLNAGYNLLFSICGTMYLTAWIIIHLLTRRTKQTDMIYRLNN